MSFNGFTSNFPIPQIQTYPNSLQNTGHPTIPYYFYMPNFTLNPNINHNWNPSTTNSVQVIPPLTSSPEKYEKTMVPNMENKQVLGDQEQNLKTKPQFCRCSKSNCRKEYCFCYKNGRSCNKRCICVGCKNDEDSLNIKHDFKRLSSLTCNCSKSKCEKKYCECFAAGKKCGEHCSCIGCKNG